MQGWTHLLSQMFQGPFTVSSPIIPSEQRIAGSQPPQEPLNQSLHLDKIPRVVPTQILPQHPPASPGQAGPYSVDQAGLKPACLCLPSAEIKGVRHHVWP